MLSSFHLSELQRHSLQNSLFGKKAFRRNTRETGESATRTSTKESISLYFSPVSTSVHHRCSDPQGMRTWSILPTVRSAFHVPILVSNHKDLQMLVDKILGSKKWWCAREDSNF